MAAKVLRFTVHGPYVVETISGKGGKTITSAMGEAFWKAHPSIVKERGCYIFAIRSGGGITPTYAGKATKGFGQETFTYHKLSEHYHPALVTYAKGRPVLFFLFHPKKKGATNKKLIDTLETYLIHQCKWRNPKGLTNKKKLPKDDWAINGVVQSTKGKPTNPALALRTLIGIPEK